MKVLYNVNKHKEQYDIRKETVDYQMQRPKLINIKKKYYIKFAINLFLGLTCLQIDQCEREMRRDFQLIKLRIGIARTRQV